MTKKHFILWLFAVLIVVLFITRFNLVKNHSAQLLIGGETINLEIADTSAKQAKGLSGRASLFPDQGMLFVFPEVGFHNFWMKDMNFPIDIIWLDANYKIVSIKGNVAPESYPETFAPSAPALYVLELPAGFAKAHGLIYNDSINLNLIQKVQK